MRYTNTCFVLSIVLTLTCSGLTAGGPRKKAGGPDVEACVAAVQSFADGEGETAKLAQAILDLDEARQARWEGLFLSYLEELHKLRLEVKDSGEKKQSARDDLYSKISSLGEKLRQFASLKAALDGLEKKVSDQAVSVDPMPAIERLAARLDQAERLNDKGEASEKEQASFGERLESFESKLQAFHESLASLERQLGPETKQNISSSAEPDMQALRQQVTQLEQALRLERLANRHAPTPAGSSPATSDEFPSFFKLPAIGRRGPVAEDALFAAVFRRVRPEFLEVVKRETIEDLAMRCELPIPKAVQRALKALDIKTLGDLMLQSVSTITKASEGFGPIKKLNLKIGVDLLANYLETFPESEMTRYTETVKEYVRRDRYTMNAVRYRPEKLFGFLDRDQQVRVYGQSNKVIDGFTEDELFYRKLESIGKSDFIFRDQARQLLHYRNRFYLHWLTEGGDSSRLPSKEWVYRLAPFTAQNVPAPI